MDAGVQQQFCNSQARHVHAGSGQLAQRLWTSPHSHTFFDSHRPTSERSFDTHEHLRTGGRPTPRHRYSVLSHRRPQQPTLPLLAAPPAPKRSSSKPQNQFGLAHTRGCQHHQLVASLHAALRAGARLSRAGPTCSCRDRSRNSSQPTAQNRRKIFAVMNKAMASSRNAASFASRRTAAVISRYGMPEPRRNRAGRGPYRNGTIWVRERGRRQQVMWVGAHAQLADVTASRCAASPGTFAAQYPRASSTRQSVPWRGWCPG
jgi:hypothetical protein